ncbi:hypothetical protein KIN20_028451 [Parelaphostrongylus tenuis]|uniref:Uncharacterized protein n=1 Tax=Parelaphostrongylus tenuis TaxID=148309 RepID=A0AAD5WEP7_PARTN|nr:hypothetical protein KIN20_028442 [Parelaphostrongylus tenuis]KAJ1367520.1 hypothetical protein KIN20_028451 [Parelaphostrongylus tenuis]
MFVALIYHWLTPTKQGDIVSNDSFPPCSSEDSTRNYATIPTDLADCSTSAKLDECCTAQEAVQDEVVYESNHQEYWCTSAIEELPQELLNVDFPRVRSKAEPSLSRPASESSPEKCSVSSDLAPNQEETQEIDQKCSDEEEYAEHTISVVFCPMFSQ